MALAGLVCWLATLAPAFGLVQFSAEMEWAREWNYTGAIAPYWVANAWWFGTAIATPLGMLGLMCFWRPARWILAVTLAVSILGSMFMGLAVCSSVEASLGSASYAIMVWLLTVSFGASAAPHFRSTNGTD